MERPTRLPQTLGEFVEHWWQGTQGDLAARLGVSEGHLSNIASGKRRPSGELALRISELTGISIAALLRTDREAADEERLAS